MRKSTALSVLVLGALAPLSSAQSVIEQLGAAGKFDSLQAALLRSGLLDELPAKGDSPQAWTLLAPSDSAFEALGGEAFQGLLSNPIVLRATLAGHLVEGDLTASELVAESPLTRMAGTPLSAGIDEGRIAFGKIRVLRVDVASTPLRVHEIDSILAPTPAMLRAAVAERIEKAVEKGAPLFNDGDKAACARVYARTLDEIVDVELLDMRKQFAKEIAATHSALEKSHDAEAQAWALRRGLDAIWARIQMQMKNDPVAEAVTLMDFADDSQRWRIVNDDVMGGISDSRFRIDGGKAVFTGRLSLENNGGFASVRSPPEQLESQGLARHRAADQGRWPSLQAWRAPHQRPHGRAHLARRVRDQRGVGDDPHSVRRDGAQHHGPAL
jgi:uncharacterized surface protein with fasciclin (FAS1) repeats